MKSYEQYLKHCEIMEIYNRKLNKKIRRYKQYLNIIYIQPLCVVNSSDTKEIYQNKLIELSIKYKWLERSFKRIKK